MKKHMMHSFLLVVSMLLVVACGTDTKENPPQADGPYAFFNATTPLTITENAGGGCTSSTCTSSSVTSDSNSTNIEVQLLKYGFAEPGQSIQMLPFDSRYGAVTNIVVETDENGFAIFEYTPPTGNEYNAIRGQSITIQAVYLDGEDGTVTTTSSSAPDIILIQDFVLQFQ